MATVKCKVKARPDGIWTVADMLIPGPLRLTLTVPEDQRWSYSPVDACSANGDLQSLIDSSRTILTTGPVGALIAKVGGSSAGVKDGAIFLVGQHCVIDTKQEWKGALYFTINDELTGMANNSGEVEVSISAEPLADTAPKPAIGGTAA